MNLSQYIIAIMVVETISCNTITGRTPPEKSRTEEEKQGTEIGLLVNGDTWDFAETQSGLITHDVLQQPRTNIMTSSEIFQAITSPKFTLQRLRRSPGSKSRRRKCDPTQETCKRKKRKNKNKGSRKGKGRRKCRKGKKGRKKCKKTPKPPPFVFPIPSPNATSSGPPEKCIRSTECPPGNCCARHHYFKVCKPMKKEGEICSRPRRKNRRNVDHFEMCECESELACKKKDKTSRLYTCQVKT